MQILRKGTQTKKPRRIAIFSDPKHGKTRLATSLPWGEVWGDTAAYIAWDQGSTSLDVVLPHHAEHIVIASPQPTKAIDPRTKEPILKFDPHEEAVRLAVKPWHKGFKHTAEDGSEIEVPPCGTLIWDTMTATARDLLYAYADSGAFSKDGHVSVGTLGSASYMANPMQGDFGLAQRAVMHILGILDKQPMNVLVLFHSEFIEPEGSGALTIGPATVGRGAIKPVASLFDNLFRLEVRQSGMGANLSTKYIVHTQKRGAYLGGMRSPLPKNPIPEFELADDPVNFWHKLDEIQGYKETK